jgi:hypothetical protein
MRPGTVLLPLGGLTLADVARWPTTPDAERAVARERW